MKYLLKFFIDHANYCKSEHQYEYNHATRMLVPRIGEHVWLPTDDGLGARYLVRNVEYDLYDSRDIDIHVVKDDEADEEDY